ncbi:hypothetical protein ACSVBT_07830 [Afipia sp. TerB]
MTPSWASSLDNLWHSPNFPMWLTLIAAGFFAVIFLITVFRADRSLANGALTVITLLAIGIAITAMMRASSTAGTSSQASALPTPGQLAGSLPALSCLDGLAGDNVETACEKALFASADSTAAAVSYSAAQITKLAQYGTLDAASKVMTPELQALRRAVERDRFGMIAHVLMVRDGCTQTTCLFFRSLSNTAQIANNMDQKVYEAIIARYAPLWGMPHIGAAEHALPGAAGAAAAAAAAVPGASNIPTGRPVSGDFPGAASIPPVSIMTPEPAARAVTEKDKPDNTAAAPRRAPPAARKSEKNEKHSAQKSRSSGPVVLAPPAQDKDN